MGKDLKVYPRQVKAILGVVPQIDNLDVDLTVIQNLTTFARYFSIPKDEAHRRSLEVLDLFQLEDKRNSRIRELSGGMKRRLLLAKGLINQPKIMIQDEPTIGLDPQARHLVWRKLGELKTQGVTQLLCTQNMEELPFAPGKFFAVDNYLEAVGVMNAIKAGVTPESVRRPLAHITVLEDNESHDSNILPQSTSVESM